MRDMKHRSALVLACWKRQHLAFITMRRTAPGAQKGRMDFLCDVLCAHLVERASAVSRQVEPEALSELQLGPAVLTPSRNNGFLNMLEAMRKRARALSGGPLPSFPSLKISAADITPQGAFAEAQAQFLRPDPAQVDRLVKVCAHVPAPKCTSSLLTSRTVAGVQQPLSESGHSYPSWLVLSVVKRAPQYCHFCIHTWFRHSLPCGHRSQGSCALLPST